MTQYAYLKASEEGRPFGLLNTKGLDLDAMLSDPDGNFGVTDFRDMAFLAANPDMNYWPEGVAVLLKFEVVVPKPVVTKWSVE